MDVRRHRHKLIDNTSVLPSRRHSCKEYTTDTKYAPSYAHRRHLDLHTPRGRRSSFHGNVRDVKINRCVTKGYNSVYEGEVTDTVQVVNVPMVMNPLYKHLSQCYDNISDNAVFENNFRRVERDFHGIPRVDGRANTPEDGNRVSRCHYSKQDSQDTKYMVINRPPRGPYKSSLLISKASSDIKTIIEEADIGSFSQTHAEFTQDSVRACETVTRETVGLETTGDTNVAVGAKVHVVQDPVRTSDTVTKVSEEPDTSSDVNVAFGAKLFDFIDDVDEQEEYDWRDAVYDVYSNMTDRLDGTSRLLSVEEKWQIIFNEKTRAPIYAVSQYIDYLNQFVDGKKVTSPNRHDVTKKEGINPVTYLLRKLKLDLKMSYESFLEEFLKPENKGLELLIKLLKSIQNTGSQQSGSTNMSQLKNYKKTLTDEHDCLICIKFTLRIRNALLRLLEVAYGLETVSMGLLSTFTKSRGTAIEILTIVLSESEGFSRTLDCFTFVQLKIGEPVRFKSLLNMMNLDSQQNIIFKVSCVKFLNALLDCSPNYNQRVFLQHELESAGLDIEQIKEKVEGRTGLEYDDLRYELDLWTRKYINVDDIITKGVAPQQHQQHLIDELKMQVQVLSKERSYLEQQLTAVSSELRNRYEELQKRIVPTHSVSVQCESDVRETRSIGCQCSHYDDFGNPLKTAALYFGWQDTIENEVMNYYDYQVNIKGHQDEESETDHVIKVEDWLRTQCDSPELVVNHSSADDVDHSRQYFRRQYSIRHKSKKNEFPGNWKMVQKPETQYPRRVEERRCRHTTNCDRCQVQLNHGLNHELNQELNHELNHEVNHEHSNKLPQHGVQHGTRVAEPPRLSSHKVKVLLESQSSDSAIGGSGERLFSNKVRVPPLHLTTKSEVERLQDLITPDDSASACPETEPPPDYSSITTRQDRLHSYQTELSEVLREFEGHLSRYETGPEFVDMPHREEFLGNV